MTVRSSELTPDVTIEETAPPVRAWRQLLDLLMEHPLVIIAFLLGCIPTFSACAIFFDTLPRAAVLLIAIGVQAAFTLLGAPVWMLWSDYEVRADVFSWLAAILDVGVNTGAVYYVAGAKLARLDTVRALHSGALPVWFQLLVSCILAAFLAYAPVKLYYRSV